MRKELLVFVNSMEADAESSVTSVTKNRDFLIINTPNGTKFTINKQELLQAIKDLDEFYKDNIVVESVNNNSFMDIEYGNT